MKATFLSILQKTLFILPLAFTLTFAHSLVVSASESTAEITIQINIFSNTTVSYEETVTAPVSNAMVVIYVDGIETTVFTNDYGIALHSGTIPGIYFARLAQADGYQFDGGKKLAGTLSTGTDPVFANLTWFVTPNQSENQTILRFVIDDPIHTINGQPNVSGAIPFIDPIQNRAMVPLRTIEEALSLYVEFIIETQTITITRDNLNLSLKIGQPLPNDMGTPLIIGGHVFVPVTYMAQMLGADIRWDRNAQAIYVKDYFKKQAQFETPRINAEAAPPENPIQPEEPVQTAELRQSPEPAVLYAVFVTDFERRALELTNAERARYGLSPLVWNDSLARAASTHSRDMARNDFVSHTGFDGATPGVRAQREGVTGIIYVAENIAAGTRTPERTIEAWMGSEKHRNNILNASFRYFGIGVYRLDGSEWVVYTTQKFGR